MLSYNPVDFSFHTVDKGLDFATQLDEPFSDLFEHYVSHDSSSSSDNAHEPIDLRLFDLPSDENTTSSGSYIADQPPSNFSHPQGGRLHRSPRIVFPSTRSSEPILQRRHHKSAYFDRPTAAISGAELLSLEGKLPHRTPSTQQRPSFSGAPTLPLRRKPKFTPETLRLSNNRVSKTVACNVGDSPTMIRQSQYQRQDTPEWTNRFEQISLHTPKASLQLSSGPAPAASRDQGEPATLPLAQAYNSRQMTLNSEIDLGEDYSTTEQTAPYQRTSSIATLTSDQFDSHPTPGRTQASTAHGLPSTWTRLSREEDFDFTISPQDLHQNWSQDTFRSPGSYYANSSAIQSAPALSQPDSTFSGHRQLVLCNPFEGNFITEDPSEDYSVTGLDPFQLPPHHNPASSIPIADSTQRASSPSSRSSSACPSPPPSAKPPPKTRRRSKSTRRKSSAGALKSPKSAGALGFVNFTPSDSQKILTGVAPSGSSKTKARRELEAIERKRRLSMAAEKAVRDAGGDPEKLRTAGLIE